MKFHSLFLAPVLIALSVGCGSKKEKPSSHVNIDAAAIVNSPHLSVDEKGERLALAAEQLLSVQGFVFADEVATLALKFDPKNLRAGFIRSMLTPILVQKGIAVRVAPLSQMDPTTLRQYERMIADLNTEKPNSTLKAFLLDGKADLQNEADVQNYIDSVIRSFAIFKQFVKEHKHSELTMMLPDSFYHTMLQRYQSSCVVAQEGTWQYGYSCPDPVHLMEVTFNRADFESLQQMAAGLEIYFTFFNSYDLTGAFRVLTQEIGRGESPSPRAIINNLSRDPRFGKLRQSSAFIKIKEMGFDAITGMRWMLAHQDKLCPLGTHDPRNRPGALVNNGICFDRESIPAFRTGLDKFEAALDGDELPIMVRAHGGEPYQTRLHIAALYETPIQNLLSLMPLTYNECESVVGVADPTIGGLFPDGDANRFILLGQRCGY